MAEEIIKCLYCQAPNKKNGATCCNCGMPLANEHPDSNNNKSRLFIKMFWGIVIFCAVMIVYLPR